MISATDDAVSAWKAHAEHWEQRTIDVEAERDALIASIIKLVDEYDKQSSTSDPEWIRDELLRLVGEE